MTDLRATPTWLKGLTQFGGEAIIGFKAKTEADPTICLDQCLAPGSSPHSHLTIVGYMVVTTNSILHFDINGDCNRASVLHKVTT